MGDNKEGEYNKRILHDSSGQTINEIKLHTKPNINSNRPRENKIISTQVSNYRITSLYLRKRKSNSRTYIIRIQNLRSRKGTPNSVSGDDGQPAHKKRYAHQKALQSIRKIRKNDEQNK